MKRFVVTLALATLAACGQKNAPPQAQTEAAQPAPAAATAAEPAGEPSKAAALAAAIPVPAGDYKIDKAHTSLIFRVNHMGFSHFTGALSPRRWATALRSAEPGGHAADCDGGCALDRDRLPRSEVRLQR